MKRLVVSLSLFFIILVGCFFEIFFINNTVSALTSEIDNIITKSDNKDIETAKEMTEKLYQEWQENQKVISTFIDHIKLEQIDQSMVQMKINLSQEQIEDFQVYSELTKTLLNDLDEMELPLLKNIL